MDRRTILGAGLLGLSQTLVGRAGAAGAATLRFVPQSDIPNLDPIWGTSYAVRNAALLVWDTLYGIDDALQPQRQMVDWEEASPDGLVWTFRLRPGLVFHDGAAVTARDAVASLRRWAARDGMGQRIAAIQTSLEALDERTFRWTLRRPFPKMLYALGKSNAPCTFVMPERIALTDPFQVIKEHVGSGPMRFVASEWVPGAKAVFERFPRYVPRAEPASWMAGGKRMLLDRIEWLFMPDGASAAGALQTGEVDWLETPLPDLLPVLERAPGIETGVASDLGIVSGIRLNHTAPPFDNPQVRRAILAAVRQEDYLNALVGGDAALRKPMNGFFTPGAPMYTEQGGEVLQRGGDLDAARRLLAGSGYRNEPIVMLVGQDVFNMKATGDVAADMLRKIGFAVDYVATDFATIQARRTKKGSASSGGWHTFQVSHNGVDCINPAAYLGLRANGEKAWFGWPDSPRVEAGIAAWYEAATPEAERAVAGPLSAAALDDVVFVPTGFYLAKQAWRRSVTGVVSAPLPVFWGVSKAS